MPERTSRTAGVVPMSTVAGFLRRDPAAVEPCAETCGQIRPLIEERDGAAAEVHHVEIDHARLHYHEKPDEVYYVIDGEGTMVLDGEEIELHGGGLRSQLRPFYVTMGYSVEERV